MKRRSLLSWLGASAAGTLTPLSAVQESPPHQRTYVLSVESFGVTRADEMPRLHAYLGGALLPLMNEIHSHPKIVLDAIVAPHTPQALLVAVFSSFDEMLNIRGRIGSYPRICRARADLESANVLEEVRSQVLIAPQESLRFSAYANRLKTGVFELRCYHAPTWNGGPPARVNAVFSRAGIHPILNASTAAGEHMPRFTCLIPFESLAVRQEAWDRLDGDSEWIDMQRESRARHGCTVKVTGKSIYKLAPYSQLA